MTQHKTYFAPPERAKIEDLQALADVALHNPLARIILESVNGYVLILNRQRQVVAANKEILNALQVSDPDCFLGLRPGEVLSCVHNTDGPEGCGTGPHCQVCGAVLTILASQKTGQVSEGECRLTMKQENQLAAVDFRVRATPLNLGGFPVTVFVLQNISSEKRREVLEQVFLHDLLDAVGGLEGWSRLLNTQSPDQSANQIVSLSTYLKDEVQFQRMLMLAEMRQLEIALVDCTSKDVFSNLESVFMHHLVARDKKIIYQAPAQPVGLFTDKSLLVRVLVNLLKNAFESTPPGGTVLVSVQSDQGKPVFQIHNDAFITPQNQMKVFERSFSTKGTGRGIGTYSARLFTENYLKGRIWFTSNPHSGTDFYVEVLPSEREAGQNLNDIRQTVPQPLPVGRHVLLVEDEEYQAMLTQLLLERLGFQVRLASNAQEALDIFSSSSFNFDFVITDLTMRGMDGLDLAKQLLVLQPALPILVCTGLDESLFEHKARQVGVRRVALKPVSIQEMEDLLCDAGLMNL